MKLCVLGGSSVHTPALIEALGKRGWTRFTEISLFGQDQRKLEAIGTFCMHRVEQYSINCKVSWSNRADVALDGSSAVLNQMRVGGMDAGIEDRINLAGSGFVAHAASYAEALRLLPALGRLLPAIRKRAADALLVNFSNPVSAACEYLATETDQNIVGLCYHTTLARSHFAKYLDVDASDLHIETFGINHVSFITDVVVFGESRMGELKTKIISQRDKDYNYDRILSADAIPISHAYSLFRTGERWYVRQDGIRESLRNVILHFTRLDLSTLRKEKKVRERAFEDILSGKQEVVAELAKAAPWYDKTIVPFLFDYFGNGSGEHTVTVRHPSERPAETGGWTAEYSSIVSNGAILPQAFKRSPSNSAMSQLRRVVRSETKLVAAIRAQSLDEAISALLIHPNVYSRVHAERFLRNYFPLAGC